MREHLMGERKLAPVKAMKAVAAACQEASKTMVESADETMRVNTPGGHHEPPQVAQCSGAHDQPQRAEEDIADHHA